MSLAKKLSSHACVSAVFYPGLDSHPGHVVAARQQSSKPSEGNAERLFGGMLSIRCAGGKEAALLTTSITKVWFPATSLGGVESLMEHRKSVEGPTSETPDDLLRLSVGLEKRDDLWMDLSKALEEAHARTSRGRSCAIDETTCFIRAAYYFFRVIMTSSSRCRARIFYASQRGGFRRDVHRLALVATVW
jgi:hypothetical protein